MTFITGKDENGNLVALKINSNGSMQHNISSTASFGTVTVAKDVAIKLLDANTNRIGVSIHNTGTKDVLIRYKTAALDNNLDGFILKSKDNFYREEIGYSGEISAIRNDSIGTQTSDINITEW